MTKEQLNALINLGFSGEQIIAINDAGKTKATPNANATPNPTPIPNPTPNANTTTPDPTPAESETVKMLKEMLGIMRAGNVNTLGMNPPAEKDASDILAEIIDPE